MDINKFQQILKQKLKEQQKVLKTATEDAELIRRPHCRDGGEIAEERERAVVIDNTLQQSQQSIIDIKNALAKIADNDYGFCDLCEDEITTQRLRITPEAEFCLSCQEKTYN